MLEAIKRFLSLNSGSSTVISEVTAVKNDTLRVEVKKSDSLDYARYVASNNFSVPKIIDYLSRMLVAINRDHPEIKSIAQLSGDLENWALVRKYQEQVNEARRSYEKANPGKSYLDQATSVLAKYAIIDPWYISSNPYEILLGFGAGVTIPFYGERVAAMLLQRTCLTSWRFEERIITLYDNGPSDRALSESVEILNDIGNKLDQGLTLDGLVSLYSLLFDIEPFRVRIIWATEEGPYTKWLGDNDNLALQSFFGNYWMSNYEYQLLFTALVRKEQSWLGDSLSPHEIKITETFLDSVNYFFFSVDTLKIVGDLLHAHGNNQGHSLTEFDEMLRCVETKYRSSMQYEIIGHSTAWKYHYVTYPDKSDDESDRLLDEVKRFCTREGWVILDEGSSRDGFERDMVIAIPDEYSQNLSAEDIAAAEQVLRKHNLITKTV